MMKPMPTLRHAEAIERARLLEIEAYEVELDLTEGAERFGSTSTVRFRCTEPGATTFVEIDGEVVSATLNGVELATEAPDGHLSLPDLAADNHLVVRARPAYSHTGEGLHRAADPADDEDYVYAQCEADNAHRVFACFDQPDLKARIRLRVTAPPEWTVLANGAGRQTGPGRWEFDEVGPMTTYVFTICAGPYSSVYAKHDGIQLGWHCRRSLAAHLTEQAPELFELTGQCLDWYRDHFGMRYPFGDKYDQVFVPEFLMGAMENIGCVTFRDEWLYTSAVTDAQREWRAAVIAHEMAHMWFGNLVTLRWWDDLWLNESFAEYMGFRVIVEATRFRDAWTGFLATRKFMGYMADQGPSTHPVAPADVPDVEHGRLNVDAISYPKGASALRQLAAWVGDDNFLAGLRRYFERHAYGNATLDDLIGTMAEASGMDLTEWSRRWLRTPQVSTLVPETATGPDGRYESVTVLQTAVPEYPTLRPHRIRIGCYDTDPAGAVVLGRSVEVSCDPVTDAGRTPVPELAGTAVPDLLLLNDNDLTFAKIRLPDAAPDRLAELLPAVRDPLPRTVLWGACWESLRDGALPASSFVDILAAGLPAESMLSVLELMQRLAVTFVTDRYLAPAARTAALARLADAAQRILADVPDDPQRRLAAVRGLAATAVTDDQVALLRDWLAGRRVPDGVAMDPELRWAVLTRLVTLDRAGVAEIDAEYEADRTATGAAHATRCRAARPDPAAKEAAFTALTTGRDLTNRHLTATGLGLWRPEHADLTAPYVPRYFELLPATADWRSPGMLQITALEGYPHTAVGDATVAAASALLTRDDLHPILRRCVTDQDHEMRIALALRA
jgi:aminopeptidase N